MGGKQLALLEPKNTGLAVTESANTAIAAYCRSWKKKNGFNPIVPPKDARAIKNMIDGIGFKLVYVLIEHYPFVEDKWFHQMEYDIPTFIQARNLNKIARSLRAQMVRQMEREEAKKAEVHEEGNLLSPEETARRFRELMAQIARVKPGDA